MQNRSSYIILSIQNASLRRHLLLRELQDGVDLIGIKGDGAVVEVDPVQKRAKGPFQHDIHRHHIRKIQKLRILHLVGIRAGNMVGHSYRDI